MDASTRNSYMQARRIATGLTKDVLVPTAAIGALWDAGDDTVRAVLATAFTSEVLDACYMVHTGHVSEEADSAAPIRYVRRRPHRGTSRGGLVDPVAVDRAVQGGRRARSVDLSELEMLSAVTRLCADGSVPAAAQQLGVSQRTVQRYLAKSRRVQAALDEAVPSQGAGGADQ